MAKVLAVLDEVVEIGNDGQLLQVRRQDMSFDPRVGDDVDVYTSDLGVRVALADRHAGASGAETLHQSGQGININLAQNVGTHGVGAMGATSAHGRVVSKTTYGLFAILLGGIGVHHFYAGKVGLGILYLLFCWTGIPMLVGIIEGIVALTKHADVHGNIVV
ncbi:MAG: hypothetical protein JWN41_641 [Thermoleophilia bacterium]|nr:hypothetical protein [Thermoleophilia bacterium]